MAGNFGPYKLLLPHGFTGGNVQLYPTATSSTISKLEVNGKSCNNGKASQKLRPPLNATDPPLTVTVEVLSQDKSADERYKVAVSIDPTVLASEVQRPTTWTTTRHYGPNRLGF